MRISDFFLLPVRNHAFSRAVARKRILCKPVLHRRAFYAYQRTPGPQERTKAITPKAEIGKESRQGLGRVRFLARLEPIRVAVGKGYPLRMIYEEQRETLGISYSQFARYVKQFVHVAGEAVPSRREKGTASPRGRHLAPATKERAGPVGFRYQPTKGDDDLV